MRFVPVGEHLDQELGIHLEHLTLDMHVVVQIVVSLLSKLDLLEVDLDSNVTYIDVLETEVLLKAIGTLVGDVAEGV